MKNCFLILIIFTFTCQSQSLDTIKHFDYKRHFDLILKESKKSKSNYSYTTQLKKYNDGAEQTPLEMLALMIGYTDNKYFEPYTDIFLDTTIYNLNEEGKFDEAIAEGEKILKDKPFLIKILRELAYAYGKNGRNAEAEKCMDKTGKIYNAMFYSSSVATGLNINKAFFALGPKDGQYLIMYFMQSKLGSMGSGHDENGYFIDILETTLEGNKVAFYFNIDHAMKYLRSKMKG